MEGENLNLLKEVRSLLGSSETGMKGTEEIEFIINTLSGLDSVLKVEFDLTLARGLNYYTGTIIEVKANDVQIGSICGGGRYDNLTGIFGLPDVSGVGISFGADRIYDVLNQTALYPESIGSATDLLVINFGEEEQSYCLGLLQEIRKAGIKSELYPDSVKLKKQMNYANNQNIPYVLMVGEEEIRKGSYTLKDMKTGDQEEVSLEQLIKTFSKND